MSSVATRSRANADGTPKKASRKTNGSSEVESKTTTPGKRKVASQDHDAAAVAASPAPKARSSRVPVSNDDGDVNALKDELQQQIAARAAAEKALKDFMSHDVTYMAQKTEHLQSELHEMASRLRRIAADAQERDTVSALAGTGAAASKGNEKGKRNTQKIFTAQNSLLSELLRVPEIQTIYHVFIAVLLVFGVSILLEEYLEKSVIFDFGMMRRAFSKADEVFSIWIRMFAASFLPPVLFTLWYLRYIPKWLYFTTFALLQTLFFTVGWRSTLASKLPVASSFIVLCEQVRLGMKMHSYMRETHKMLLAEKAETSQGKQWADLDINTKVPPTFEDRLRRYVFFLFAPTLIYRNEYPRTGAVRFSFVVQRFGETFGCVLYTYVIFKKFCLPQFEKTAQDPGDLTQLVASIFTSTLPGILVFMMGFFGILHSWSNAFAELLRFADRKFYTDWWNATSFSVYYRKWNIIVHDWLFAYLYVDIIQLGYSSTIAMLLVFAVSAIVHEYIISFALGFFYPVMLVMFGGVGVFFIFLTKMGRGNRAWNVFMWAMLLIGNGMLMVFYSREWFARNTDLSASVYDKESWIPLSLQPFLGTKLPW